MTAEQEDEILRVPFSLLDELNEGGRIERAAGGIEEDFAGRGVASEEIKAGGRNFAHLAGCVAGGALDEFGCDGVGVGIARFTNEVEENFRQALDMVLIAWFRDGRVC